LRFIGTARRLLVQIARVNQSSGLANAWLGAVAALNPSPSPFIRRLTDVIQVSGPIESRGGLPQIDILVPCDPRDFELLRPVIDSALENVLNPVFSVHVVVPDRELEGARSLDIEGNLLGEEALLPESLKSAVTGAQHTNRRGWLMQQVVKFFFTWQSQARGVLVLDADTVLLRPRAFLSDSGKQLLSFSHEYVPRYEDHAGRVWGPRARHKGFSYVTHHQLMQPWIVREMFPRVSDMVDWVCSSANVGKSDVSEYHSYGRWLSDQHPELVALARWENKSTPRSLLTPLDSGDFQDRIRAMFPQYFSASLHAYLR